MARPARISLSLPALAITLALCLTTHAQTQPTQTQSDRPLPDIPTLMHEVESHQRAAEAIQKDYTYRSVATAQEFDGSGHLKKTTVEVYDVFWINGVPVRKLIRKDGKDLTDDEKKKEDERIDKEVAKARERREKADDQGKETDPRGHDEITVSRFLELGSFTNPRRVQLNGRDTIAVDFAGNPKAKTRNRAEDVVKDLVGTIWIDEQDHVIAKTEGHFLNAFKIGAGLLVNIRKDTSFGLEQKQVNGEVWLPSRIHGEGAARAFLLFSFNGNVQVTNSDYRKFKATSTILPGVIAVEPTEPATPSTPPSAPPSTPASPNQPTPPGNTPKP